jgi:cytochrome c biogenesis factor
MSISSSWLTAEDSDIILNDTTKSGGVFVKILVKPLINLIWLAGFIFVVGCVITLWPDAREERRLAERYAELRATAAARA